ncbi:hypothetical protein [Tenuifilum thalassicum]|uniref:Porin family protein n=1 Tax=Tenuifilum thalassicum TaxID=2590900 RepID=A0A7D3XWP1_9BACT|nr:hypothetical protein [Tenuifilum thalassicum]QKG80551.1 hypothetical protein FHG85_09805 [Tenuifilum thalassicum]
MAMVRLRRKLHNILRVGYSISIAATFLLTIKPNIANCQWFVNTNGGVVYNVPLPLNIYQEGYPSIKMNAQFRTEPFTLPVYWAVQVGREGKNSQFASIEFIHHKLYLNNTNPTVSKFNVSHGFNMLIASYGYSWNEYSTSIGLGFVIAHPESEIREMEFGSSTDDWDMGYYLTGPVFAFSAKRNLYFANKVYGILGLKVTGAYARLPINQGHASFVNIAGHINFGIGVKL